jgi:hypothetical protein
MHIVALEPSPGSPSCPRTWSSSWRRSPRGDARRGPPEPLSVVAANVGALEGPREAQLVSGGHRLGVALSTNWDVERETGLEPATFSLEG